MTQLAEPKIVEPRRRRWTRREYYKLAESGYFDGQRVELVAGEIVEMAPQRDTHFIGIGLATDAVQAAFGQGYWARVQSPLNLSRYDDPEPDIAVVIGKKRDYLGSNGRANALLVIEVSDTTLRYDRVKKARRYARAGIADYWIVNLKEAQLEVYRDPSRRPIRYEYAPAQIFKRGQSVAPLAAPNARILVDDLLP